MTISVRQALTSDADSIARLTRQLGYECESSDVAVRLARILERSDQEFVVADADGAVAGWAHALVTECVDHEAFVLIGGLVVDSAHRRHGIGRLLMRHAEEWARARGCQIVRLTSSSTRTAAHQFYEQLGYAKIKTQYAFVKSLDGEGREGLNRFVPRVEEA